MKSFVQELKEGERVEGGHDQQLNSKTILIRSQEVPGPFLFTLGIYVTRKPSLHAFQCLFFTLVLYSSSSISIPRQ